MTDPTGLLDTSVLIDLDRVVDAATLPEEPLISSITLAELAAGPTAATTEAERAPCQARLQQAEADFAPLPFGAAEARAFGIVAASLRESGRKPAERAFDVLIAAVALANDLPLYTRNPRDFAGIEGLAVRSVEVPGSTSA